MKSLIETWEINSRINEYLLSGIKEEHLKDALVSKGRNVGEQFSHINNVRLMWVKVAAPELLSSLPKIEKTEPITKKILLEALKKSEKAITQIFENSFETGKI